MLSSLSRTRCIHVRYRDKSPPWDARLFSLHTLIPQAVISPQGNTNQSAPCRLNCLFECCVVRESTLPILSTTALYLRSLGCEIAPAARIYCKQLFEAPRYWPSSHERVDDVIRGLMSSLMKETPKETLKLTLLSLRFRT